MLGPRDFVALTPALSIILWIEAIIYLGIGLVELFDDVIEKPKPWMTLNGRVNGYLRLQHKVGHKMHAGLCVILGAVALNGLIDRQVSRFDIELIFLSLGLIMSVIWSTKLPGRLGVLTIILKPEFWLQIAMFALFFPLIRPGIALICLALNIWGLAVLVLRGRRDSFAPYTTQAVLRDMTDAVGDAAAQRLKRFT